jgi:NAD(P)H-dependent FMN reductase
MEIVVVYGSVRTARQGIKAARWVVRKLRERGHGVTLLDAVELGLPLLDRMFKEYPPGEAPPALETTAGHLRRADAFDELEWYARALAAERAKGTPY